ncbi:serine/arginine repetitive matrix protein 1-like [Sander lucioperca]|uniref:serine/arginine repetitive matrix protein 1-like n=1 Tax=Sander lucioperca TaxID=283035 RepID=UPI0016535C26|nr:serine/arginine repetitive matrix protein 1-like [Sander lucioperca]
MSCFDDQRLGAKASNEPTDTVLQNVVACLILDSVEDRNNLDGYEATCDEILQDLLSYIAQPSWMLKASIQGLLGQLVLIYQSRAHWQRAVLQAQLAQLQNTYEAEQRKTSWLRQRVQARRDEISWLEESREDLSAQLRCAEQRTAFYSPPPWSPHSQRRHSSSLPPRRGTHLSSSQRRDRSSSSFPPPPRRTEYHSPAKRGRGVLQHQRNTGRIRVPSTAKRYEPQSSPSRFDQTPSPLPKGRSCPQLSDYDSYDVSNGHRRLQKHDLSTRQIEPWLHDTLRPRKSVQFDPTEWVSKLTPSHVQESRDSALDPGPDPPTTSNGPADLEESTWRPSRLQSLWSTQRPRLAA